MSNPDSFIEEVTEEVRRDRLFGLFRKYGWIGVVVILALVGGTAWTEWQKSRDAARAEAFGDALIDALDHGTPEERREALASVPATGEQVAILNLILGSDPAEDKAATLAALESVANNAALSPAYRDLAVLRRVLVGGADLSLADRRAALDGIAVAGRPYRTLAAEQLAYLLIEEGKPDAAIAALGTLMQDQEASAALRARVGQVITALGGTLPEPANGG
ncbi:hypothetical protein [Tabrizicola flagellatus]|uniref:hypothetical protein n=1 Tax=Tabrizicola flagellatus TaxID=2593021 RepID=UPI0011F10BB1|nr:hypothetical protein [Tabrizicola flagellatus]